MTTPDGEPVVLSALIAELLERDADRVRHEGAPFSEPTLNLRLREPPTQVPRRRPGTWTLVLLVGLEALLVLAVALARAA